MGFGGLLNQLATTTAGGGMGAIVENYPVASGYSVSAGDVVDVNESGQVTTTIIPQTNTEVIFRNSSIQGSATCDLGDNYFVVGSYYNNGGQLVVGHINSDGTVNFTSPESFSLSFGQTFSLSRLTDTRFFLATNYNNIFVCGLFELNKESFSITKYDWIQNTTGSVTAITSVALSENLVLLVYNRSGLKARLVTISGNSGSFGAEYSLSSITSASNISAALLSDDSSGNKRVCVGFNDNSATNGKAVIISVNTSNTITFNSPVMFVEADVSEISLIPDGNYMIFSYISSSAGYAKVLTVSGNNLYANSSNPVTLGSANVNYSAGVKVGNSIVVVEDTNSNGVAYVINRNGTNLTASDSTFNQGITEYISAASISSSNFICCYKDASTTYGTCTILEVRGNQIAGSFITTSTQAIALQSGNAGQTIPVCYSGIVKADWATEGQQITSDGVYGAGIVDGVLQVWSKYRPELTST